MESTVTFDEAPLSPDELAVSRFDNELLATLVMFALAIRDHRRDPAAIRETLLSFIFAATPADRAAILPPAGENGHFEPIGRNRNEELGLGLRG